MSLRFLLLIFVSFSFLFLLFFSSYFFPFFFSFFFSLFLFSNLEPNFDAAGWIDQNDYTVSKAAALFAQNVSLQHPHTLVPTLPCFGVSRGLDPGTLQKPAHFGVRGPGSGPDEHFQYTDTSMLLVGSAAVRSFEQFALQKLAPHTEFDVHNTTGPLENAFLQLQCCPWNNNNNDKSLHNNNN